MNMKQFNLEEYLANPSKKIVTRGGRKVEIICTGLLSTSYPVVALVSTEFSAEQRMTFTKDGKFISSDKLSRNDLFFV